MGIWILFMILNLILPSIMLTYGYLSLKHPVENINKRTGYRSKRANASQEAWDLAQSVFSKLWVRFGWVFLVFSIVLMLLVLGQKQNVVALFGIIICLVECIAIFIPTIVVEKLLQSKFSK